MLRAELPGLKGFSERNIKNMRTFYEQWILLDNNPADASAEIEDASTNGNSAVQSAELKDEFVPLQITGYENMPLTAFLNISFSHHILILRYAKTLEERMYYIQISNASDFAYTSYDSTKYNTGEVKKHLAKNISTNDVVAMLADYAVGTYSDVVTKSMAIRYIQYLETIGKGEVKVIFMSQNITRNSSVDHDPNGSWVIKKLFQGRSNINESDNYCGDRNIADPDMITIQIHHINLTGLSVSDAPHSETYALAIHFPKKLEALYFDSVAKIHEQED